MIGIESIGFYIPDKRIDNNKRLQQFNVDRKFITDKTGMINVSIKENDKETSDLCVLSYNNLCEHCDIESKNIDCIIVCTQNPDDYGLPHTSAIVHGKLNLKDDCAAFDISLGCSGYVYGLSIIQSFMEMNKYKNGILFTSDPYSKVIDPNDKNVALLFGDAATATLLGNNAKWTSGKYLFGTRGSEHKAIRVRKNDRKLEMNGRGVFSFSIRTVPENIKSMLRMNNILLDNIDCFVLHQGSRYIVNTIADNLGVNRSKVLFSAEQYGNTVSSSIPLILSNLDPHINKVVIAGFGVGLSWGSTVITRKLQD